MGSDGGVCYVKMRDPSKKSRALELLRPFHGLLNHGFADWAENQTLDWEDAHPKISSSSDYILGYYSSSQDYDLGALADLFRYFGDREGQESFESQVPDPSLTFVELLEDLATRPMFNQSVNGIYYLGKFTHRYGWDLNGREISIIEQLLWSYWGWRNDFSGDDADHHRNEFAPIADMKVIDWLWEMNSLVDWSSLDREETWT
jgi:hypothetical protein